MAGMNFQIRSGIQSIASSIYRSVYSVLLLVIHAALPYAFGQLCIRKDFIKLKHHKIQHSLSGRCPILPGWNLGISKFTKKREAALQFLNWFCHQDISSCLTILDGQSTVQEPYENNELKRLYPWLSLTTDSLNYCRKRRPPLKKGGNIIPPNKMESIITDAFYKTCKEPSQLEAFLEDAAQEQMIALFKEYKIVS